MDLTASSRRFGVEVAAGLAYAVLFGSVAIWVMRRYQTRRAVNLAKGQMDLVAFVSHELRTPLMAILSTIRVHGRDEDAARATADSR